MPGMHLPFLFSLMAAAFYIVAVVLLLALAWRFVAAVERIADALERHR